MDAEPTARVCLEATSEAETQRIAEALAQRLPEGTVLAINGTLGAGKTRFVQGLATGLGIDATMVMSPTYGLCHEHESPTGSHGLNHMDLYRVVDTDELFELGFDEYVASARITAIEWADRFRSYLPTPRLEIELEVTGEDSRRVQFTLIGQSSALTAVLDSLR